MIAYLIGQEGPYAEAVFALEEGEEWTLGRDPDVSTYALSDPTVSRKHARIFIDDGIYYIENLSTINPLLINGNELKEVLQLQEDDIIQIGNNFLRFTEHLPQKIKQDLASSEKEMGELADILPALALRQTDTSRWIAKVISGPNAGAEFGINPQDTLILGKDSESSDIVFQDLSVSRQHARITANEIGLLNIEDLGSKNGVFVNGAKVEGLQSLDSQDLISLGTTSFLVIDRDKTRETIYSPAAVNPSFGRVEKEQKELAQNQIEEEPKNWKKLFIPTRHLVVASVFSLIVLSGIVGIVSLFRSQSVIIMPHDESKEIYGITKNFSTIEFSFNPNDGTVFLIGHLLTEIDHSELIYLIKTLPFIKIIDDNTVVDELVWSNLNALIAKNPKWRSILVTASKPGEFVMRGYLQTMDDAAELNEYVNRNFSYLSKLTNDVIVENNLQTEIQFILMEEGFVNTTFQFNNGELILAGRTYAPEESKIKDLIKKLEKIQGVRIIKNFIIFTGESTSRIDLSQNYNVMGTSKYGDMSQYVLINGRILSDGDVLDGMIITSIESNKILLDKEGMKYKIDFNNQ
jgi:type III secretion system YscD/HrpQ family protein